MLSHLIADRIADEERARAQLDRFAGRLFDAAEALAHQLKTDGVEAPHLHGQIGFRPRAVTHSD